MTKTISLLTKISLIIFALIMPFALFDIMPIKNSLKADTVYDEYSNSVSITNSSFNSTSSVYSKGDVTGWTRKWKNTGATTMIIDVTDKFSDYMSSEYFLKENPGKKGYDNKIMMINSASSSPNATGYNDEAKSEGYISNTISLSANSYYQFQVSMKTTSFTDSSEFGSIYISGLVDENGQSVELASEKKSSSTWQTYYFYISTANTTQTITIDLWLGTDELPSPGAVFFDDVIGIQLSENAYYNNMEQRQSEGKEFVSVQLEDRNIIDTTSLNFDFEKSTDDSLNNLVDWNKTNCSANAHAMILDMNEGNFKNITTFTYPGTDLSYENTKSMVLWSTNDGYVSTQSLPFEIKSHGLYKLTMYVKTADLSKGAFTVSLNETSKIKEEFEYLENYTLKSATSSSITSNSTNNFINGYTELTFYIQGHNRYDSELELQLNLGSESNLAKGAVVIDNITLELVSSENFKTDGNLLELTTLTTDITETIANGQFNKSENGDNKLNYPLIPANWEISQSSSAWKKEIGIINIYNDYFNSYSNTYNYYWAEGLSNPGSPNKYGSTNDVNNILMIYNQKQDYQSISSTSFEIAKNTYKKLSFSFKTYGENASINVKLIDEDGFTILNDKAIFSSEWSVYECVINSGESTKNLQLVIELGTQEEKVSGYVFIDYVELVDSDEESFQSSTTQIDLSGFMLNLDPNNEITNTISTSIAFSGTHESGSNANGGIIKGANNDSYYFIDKNGEAQSIDDGSLITNVLVIETNTISTYKLTSNFSLNLTSGSYYKLSFRLLTSFPSYTGSHIHNGKETDSKFGVKIGLSNYSLIEGLISNEGWKEFTIFFSASEDLESNFIVSLVSDCLSTTGYAYVTDIKWEESDSDSYNSAKNNDNFGKTIFTTTLDASDEEDDEDSADTNENQQSPSTDNTTWLLVPSLIMGLALIIAIVGFSLRHIKVKKFDKKTKENYDREQSLHADILMNEAKDIQKAEIESLKEKINELSKELEELENKNKETIALSRKEGKVTKDIEKQFKSYAQKRNSLQKTIEEYNEHLTYVESSDYLLSIQKKLISNKENNKK